MNKTVVVAMSGGVDSSVAALLLKEQGYNCIGITMKLWDHQTDGGNINHESGCCSLDSINDARAVCTKLGIKHYVLNLQQDFQNRVINDFVNEYLAGHTPNPCVQCNVKIKWNSLINKANELGADYIATGHYARIDYNKNSKRYELCKGKYTDKDQSYALWGICQEDLSRTLFPLSEFKKSEVREIARKNDLRTANKKESMEICFIPDNDYHRFLKNAVPGLDEKTNNGALVDSYGVKIGEHKGFPFFTVGQRRGIGTGFGKPMYVIEIKAETNQVVIGEKKELFARGLSAKSANYISIAKPINGVRATIKIRYNDPGSPGIVFSNGDDTFQVQFDKPKEAITPGQSVVFYDGNRVLGGGIIDQVKRDEHSE